MSGLSSDNRIDRRLEPCAGKLARTVPKGGKICENPTYLAGFVFMFTIGGLISVRYLTFKYLDTAFHYYYIVPHYLQFVILFFSTLPLSFDALHVLLKRSFLS